MKKRLVQNQSTKGDPVIERMPAACADELKAVEFMEELRWGKHPACPLCGDTNVYKMQAKDGSREKNFRWRCRGCKGMYSVRKGTVMEDSAIAFRHWCYAYWRAAASKKGVSALELHRQLGISYKSALFLMNRIRKAMETTPVEPLKGDVEVDELYIGGVSRKPNYSRKSPVKTPKTPVLGIVERGGRVRPMVLPNVTWPVVKDAIRSHVDQTSRILTDDHRVYQSVGKYFAGGHETVRHSVHEYARGDVHTNTIEGFFGLVRRSLDGIYHSVSKKHLHRYLGEFEFRYNNRKLSDGERAVLAIRQSDGKRLTHKECVRG